MFGGGEPGLTNGHTHLPVQAAASPAPRQPTPLRVTTTVPPEMGPVTQKSHLAFRRRPRSWEEDALSPWVCVPCVSG